LGKTQYEKLEIICTVEGSHLLTKQTLDMLRISRSTFYRWYNLHANGGFDALADSSPRPRSVWNRIPDVRHAMIIMVPL
jgi:predicted DNA-binding transcriptional regulator AlpA